MLSAVVLLAIAQPQMDFSKVEVKAIKASGSVYMLEGAGGNIAVSAGEDGILIVDDQFAPLAPKIKAAMATLTDKPVRFVLNTHWHFDHTGGNELFGSTSAPIIAHENVRKRLMVGAPAWKIPPAGKGALPVITFDDKLSIHLNGEEIKAIHLPAGHTDGDIVVWFTKSNVVHMGDDFTNGKLPFIDLDSGGSARGLLANVQKIIPTIPADAKVIPGHGPMGGVKEMKAFAAMLEDAIHVVETGKKAGRKVEQLQKEKVLAKYEPWAHEFVTTSKLIEVIYKDLEK